MTKNLYQGEVSGNTSQRSFTLLISSAENELLQGTKNCHPTGRLDKEVRHMYSYLQIQTLLNDPFFTTHTPLGGKYPINRTISIEYVLNRTEECA